MILKRSPLRAVSSRWSPSVSHRGSLPAPRSVPVGGRLRLIRFGRRLEVARPLLTTGAPQSDSRSKKMGRVKKKPVRR